MSRQSSFLSFCVAVVLCGALASCGGGDKTASGGGVVTDVSARLEAELDALEYQNLAWICGLEDAVLPASNEAKDVLRKICNEEAFASLWSPTDAVCVAEVITEDWSGSQDFLTQLDLFLDLDFSTEDNVTMAGEAYNAVVSASVECLDARTVLVWYDEKKMGYSPQESACRADLVGDVLNEVWPVLLLNGRYAETEVEKAAVITHVDNEGIC